MATSVFAEMAQQDELNLTTDDPDDMCYESALVEKVSSPALQLLLILLYSATAFCALLGNAIVIAVQLRANRESSQNIRKYLINLAVSDIVIGVICVPFMYTDFMLGKWVFPLWLCPMSQYAQLLSVFITANTLTIIGIERYVATIHPLSGMQRWLQSQSYTLVGGTWLAGAIYAYIPMEHTFTEKVQRDNITYWDCNYDNGLSEFKRRFYMTLNCVLTFVVPSVIMVFAYTAIMRKLMSSHKSLHMRPQCVSSSSINNSNSSQPNAIQMTEVGPLNNSEVRIGKLQNGHHHQTTAVQSAPAQPPAKVLNGAIILRQSVRLNRNRSKTIKIMLIVIILYALCWMPIKTFQFLLEFDLLKYCTEEEYHWQIAIYIACHWLAMANSFVNPIIYSFMSQRFRSDFHKLVQSFWQYRRAPIK